MNSRFKLKQVFEIIIGILFILALIRSLITGIPLELPDTVY